MNRTTFLDLLGDLPLTCEPLVEIISEEECEGFIRQKISYQTEDTERISAYLCIPDKAKQETPAIFCHHQHAGNFQLGKSEVVGLKGDPTQAYAMELTQRGYITISPDAIGFEERSHPTHPDEYHHHLLKTRLLKGQTLLGKTLHDISMGISVLINLPIVNPNKIGFIGHSYGGRAALFAPAFDKRITSSISVCGCSSFQYMLDNETGIQADYCVPDFLKHGDIPDVVKLFENCSLCLLAATEDKWSQSSDDIARVVASSFISDELFVKTYSSEHVFNDNMKQDAYNFIERTLSI